MRIQRKPLVHVDGVSNIELFYDLIFVYCISALTSLCHHVENGFLSLSTWTLFCFAYLVVLQIWIFTTFLLNRYGDRSALDNLCLFTNMFLLYYLASGIHADWESSRVTFFLAWAGICVNLAVHWGIKRWRYTNLDEDDRHIMTLSIRMLLAQAVGAIVAALAPLLPSVIIAGLTLVVGAAIFRASPTFGSKTARFSHLAERCSLLVIIAFGEMVVSISSYMNQASSPVFPVLVFVLVVGLFLIFMYEHDTMLDHNKQTDGSDYQAIICWIILIIGNLTVALEYMTKQDVAFEPKSIFLTVFLVLYLLTSFLVGFYHKPKFAWSRAFVAGRVCTCLFIVVFDVATNFNPLANLLCHTFAVYFALWHEWLLYHNRTGRISFGHLLGHESDE